MVSILKMKKILFLILLLIFTIVSWVFLKKINTLKLISFGSLSEETYEDYYGLVANLYGDKHEFIVSKRNNFFRISRFERNVLNSIHQIPIDKIDTWVCGDLNRNGKDEIIIFNGSLFQVYEWGKNKFAEEVYNLLELKNHKVYQAVIGDIDNDSSNELILFSYPKNLPIEKYSGPLYLSIWKYKDRKVKMLWSDQERLGFSSSGMIPPETLVCVGDIFNEGRNHLIVKAAQSDASPSIYIFLSWSKNRLKFKRTAAFINYKVVRFYKNEDKLFPYIWQKFKVIKIKNQTKILAPIFDKEGDGSGIIKISKNRFEIENILREPPIKKGRIIPGVVHWINIDGKGKGILHITANNKYYFYRYKSWNRGEEDERK